MNWELLNQILVLFNNSDKQRKAASKYSFCGRKVKKLKSEILQLYQVAFKMRTTVKVVEILIYTS